MKRLPITIILEYHIRVWIIYVVLCCIFKISKRQNFQISSINKNTTCDCVVHAARKFDQPAWQCKFEIEYMLDEMNWSNLFAPAHQKEALSTELVSLIFFKFDENYW